MYSQALLPYWIQSREKRILLNVLSILGGSILLAGLAHVAIPLPWTPVPITGQTFAVALLALTLGSQRALSAFLLYLLEGFAGLPVFASATAGGATFGYLIGMFIASGVVGVLADKGYARSLGTAFLSCVTGSLCVFAVGLLWLSHYVPREHLLQLGLLPFLFGDLVKNFAAASVAVGLGRLQKP